MRTPIVLCCAYLTVTLAGCASPFAPSQLEPPAAVLLVAPPKLPEVKEGDDAIKALIETRRKYASIVDRHRRLQKYVNTILKR